MKRMAAALLLAFAVAGCASGAGAPSRGFAFPAIKAAYIPLSGMSGLSLVFGAAIVVQPGIAVTSAHTAHMVSDRQLIGRDPVEDLAFFRTVQQSALPVAEPRAGETVLLYGQGPHGSLRETLGAIHLLGSIGFTIIADAGPGFSGGPVIDAADGRLLGITYGYKDEDGRRWMIAYDMAFVHASLDRLLKAEK